MEKSEMIITALQQRIGEIVSNYETQIAILRAEITSLVNKELEKEEAIKQYSDSIAEKVGIDKITDGV